MSEFRKLFRVKRILAMALAIVLAVTSVPATARAAEPGEPQAAETDVGDTSTQDSTEEDEAPDTEAAGSAVTAVDASSQEGEDADAKPQTPVDDGQEDAGQQTPVDGGQEDAGQQMPVDDGQEDAESPTPANDTLAEGDAAGVQQPKAETAETKFRFSGEDIDDTEKMYRSDGSSRFADATGKKLSTSFLGKFILVMNGGTEKEELLWLDELENAVVKTVKYQWFEGDTALGDAKLLGEEGTIPADAGSYTLKLSLDGKAETYAAAEKSFNFEITHATVDVETAEPEYVVPGTAVGAVPEPEVYSVESANGQTFTYVLDDKDTADKDESKDNDVKFTTVVKDAETGNPVTEGALTGDKEYVITVMPEFIGANKEKYERNYVFNPCAEQKLVLEGFKKTRLTLTLDAKYDDAQKYTTAKNVTVANDADGRTVHIIEAGSLADVMGSANAPSYTGLVLETEDGRDDKGETKWKAFEVEDKTLIEGAWYTAASYKVPWTEAGKAYCNLTVGGKMDAAPTTVGAYVYRVSYKGDQKEYGASYADILVIVEAVELVVHPTVPEKVEFYDGQPIREALAKITYELLYADGRTTADGKPQVYPATDNMWGTSYADTSMTQPYKPDFDLIEIVKDKDGKETERHTYNSQGYDTENGIGDARLKVGNEYIVRFNGYKAVYESDGIVSNRVEINKGVNFMNPDTCGYKVKTGSDIYEKYEEKLDVKAANKKIVADDIKANGMEPKDVGALKGAFAKVFDGNKIFLNHSDYKKAKLDSGSADANNDFSYTWRKSTYSYDEMEETQKVDGKEELVVSEKELKDSFTVGVNGVSLKDAGIYRLEITYTDPKGKDFAEPVYVYFIIEKQEITLTLNKTSLVGNEGNTPSDFLTNHAEELYTGTAMNVTEAMSGKPTKSEDWKNSDLLTEQGEGADYAYDVTWAIYEKQKVTDAATGNEVDAKDEDGNPVLSPLGKWDAITESTDKYVLCADSVKVGRYLQKGGWSDVNSENFDVKQNLSVPITVEKMGEAEIKFAGITTVDGESLYRTKTYDAQSVYHLIQGKLAALNDPITVKEDGKTENAKVTFAEGEKGLVYTVVYFGYEGNETVEKYDKLPTEEADWAWAKNAGSYVISVEFGGSKNYQPLSDVRLAYVEVNPFNLTLKVPALTKTYQAGEKIDSVFSEATKAFEEQDGPVVWSEEREIPAEDMKYFTKTDLPNGEKGYFAWYNEEGNYRTSPDFVVYDKTEGYSYSPEYDNEAVFRATGSKRYMLRYNAESWNGLQGDCANNYWVAGAEPVEGTPITVVRGASNVKLEDYYATGIDSTDKVTDGAEGSSVAKEHKVTVQDGIPYYNNFDGDSGIPEGNLVRITIDVPAEYYESDDFDWDKVIYEKSIKNAAKGNLVGNIETDFEYGQRTLRFLYDATDAIENRDDLTFSIRWAADYNENFTILFSTATGLGNLKDAVAPKSLAFNAPVTSMVVGEEQELDVKITKEQNSDIICLGYEVTSGKEYMHVSEHGTVTALTDGGKATVEVYPMHLVNGKKTRIEGAKTAKVNISVKKVSAPKVSKVIAKDDSVTVQYALPKQNDGYRREIYVVEGKNVKAEEIEDQVVGMKNEQWKGIFAAEPVFIDYYGELRSRVHDTKKHIDINTVELTVGGLKPGKTDYTVYVRNVSAARSFEDGCKVSLCPAGTAKGFTTTMKQVDDIVATLDGKEISEIDWQKLNADDEIPTAEAIRSANQVGYEVPLADNKVKISLEGIFGDNSLQEDEDYQPLALGSDAKKKYIDPKISYYFVDYIYDGYDAYYGGHIIEDEGYTTTSSIATVDKKGNVTLKQPGNITIVAIDTVSGVKSEELDIHITAEADSMKAKNITMQVGQSIRLENMVDYKQGKLTLDQAYYNTYGRMDVKAAQASLGANELFGISDEGYLTAYGVGNVQFTLTDTKLKQSNTVDVKVKSKALDAVKNLKAVNVIDNRFDVQFEMNPYAEAYRIEIENARKKMIRSIYVENIPFVDNLPVEWDDRSGWVKDNEWNDDDWGDRNWITGWDHSMEHWVKTGAPCRSDKVNGKWTLTYRMQGMTQSSKYNIKVTALYKEADPSKTVTKAVTTTKMPAFDECYTNKIGTSTRNKEDYPYQDGMAISVVGYYDNGKETDPLYMNYMYPFVSGNTYSLRPEDHNKGAQYAGTDTLTWSSNNKKVASVQATAGGYGATLKALKDGETVIEVKSKVLKNVIARYTIRVSTVGDAYRGRDHWGDNEDLRGEGDGKKELITEMTVGVPTAVEIGLEQDNRFRFKFTVLEEGEYGLYKIINGSKRYMYWSCSKYDSGEPETFTGEYSVEPPFTGSFVIERKGSTDPGGIGNRTVIELDETVRVESNAWYVFTAPEEGMYGFKSGNSSDQSAFFVYRQAEEKAARQNISIPESPSYFYSLKKDELVYLKAQRNNSVKVVKAVFEPLKAGDNVEISDNSEKWFEFTPAEMDQYEFRMTTGTCSLTVYDSEFRNVYANSSYDSATGETVYTCNIGAKTYIRVYNEGKKCGMAVTKKDMFQKFGTDGTYTISNRTFNDSADYLYITYTVPDDGFYSFSYEAAEQTESISGYMRLYKADNLASQIGECPVYGNGNNKMSDKLLSKGEEVCVKINTQSSTPATWENVKIAVAKAGAVPVALSVGGEAVAGKVSSGVDAWYSFAASEGGRYKVTFPKAENASGYLWIYFYDNPNGGYLGFSHSVDLSQGGSTESIAIEAGNTKYFKVVSSSSSEAAFTVKVEKVVTSGKTVTEQAPADLADAENWVSFTADADAYYAFGITRNAGNANNWMKIWKSITDQNYEINDYVGESNTIKLPISQGETVWLQIAAETLAEGGVADQLTVAKLGEVNVCGSTQGTFDNLKVVTDGEEYYAVVKYTLHQYPYMYRYRFSCTGSAVTEMKLYANRSFNSAVYSEYEQDGNVYILTAYGRYMSSEQPIYLKIDLDSAVDGLSVDVAYSYN